jgi:hypothetical protein
MYGVEGTITIAGGMGDSGTLPYTFAARALNALDKAERVSAIELAGTIAQPFQRLKTVEVMTTPCL